MKNDPIKYMLWFLMLSLIMAIPWKDVSASTKTSEKIWPLTGQEVLLDVTDFTGKMNPGIYVLPVGASSEKQSLRLLIPYGSHPKWSWHHKKIVYYFNGDIWLCDLDGNKAPLFPFPAQAFKKGYSDTINWSFDGKLLFTIHSVVWGSKVFVGPNVENTPISELKKKYTLFFSTIGSGVFVVIPYGKRSQSGISEFGGDLSWADVNTTNNPSFSPDGLKLAVEVYPSSPEDLERKKSRILLYDMYEKTPDESVSDKGAWIKKTREHFYISNFIPLFNGVGRELTKATKNNTELKPLWSPDGKWIVYTEVNYTHGYMIPKVIAMDGKEIIPLVTDKFESWGHFSQKGSWLPVKPIDTIKWLKNIKNQATGIESWGNPHRMAQEWSRDGKYLWMTRGNDGIYVAKHENGQWFMRQVAESSGSEFGFGPIAYNDKQVAWVADSGDRRKIFYVVVADIDSQIIQSFKLPHAVHVNSIDW